MIRAALLLALLLVPGAAHAFTVYGRFLYEDRVWNGNGYTGTVQNLPIRRAKVEIVSVGGGGAVIGTGYTDAAGNFAVPVNGQSGFVTFYARCLTDGRPFYQTWVVDALERDRLGGWVPPNAPVHAVTSDPVLLHPANADAALGTYLIQDTDGHGVAQAFNIFDCAVDYFDWLKQPGMLGRLPSAAEYVTLSWGPNNANEGSNYTANTILLASPGQGNDTDGWSDTVILHEIGHWLDDVFSHSDNPGGPHFIGDNNANVLLAYGEGAATFHCAKVREFRALAHGTDNLVSLYGDLAIPPPLGTPGGLSFSYDFETGTFADDGAPIGQRGSANETNVTSALWDLIDGPATPDATPGVDDDTVDETSQTAWAIETTYLRGTLPDAEAVTVEDYYQGWFALNGAGFHKPGVDHIFVTLSQMPFYPDAFESDNSTLTAGTVTPVAHTLAAGRVVINEIDMGPLDAIELYNGTAQAVDLTGWRLTVFTNAAAPEESLNVYVFPAFTLQPGAVVAVHEGGDPVVDDGEVHLYAGNQQVFNAAWNNGLDGACLLSDDAGNPVDFVRWRDAQGVDNDTPVPAGLGWSGLLDTPPAPGTLARDIHGTDTDVAADWSGHYGSIGSANHPAPQSHTVFGIGDLDVIGFSAVAGTRYGFEARSYYSASDARIELLDGTGALIGANSNVDPSVRDARIEFIAPTTGTFYVRITHEGANTDWAEYDLLAFQRPPSTALVAPAGVSASAANTTDTGDAVTLTWANSSSYDSIRVYRDGTRIADLPGNAATFTENVDRGLYEYEVAGMREGTETNRVGDHVFAGAITCYATDGFESGGASLWIREESEPGSRWDVTPLAQSGVFGFTDSPAGTYRGCPAGTGGCAVNAIAQFAVPAKLRAGSTLEWDQICITEATFDYCIVELSANGGASWTELARFDQAADPRWGDNVAEPGDWRHESVSLAPWVNQEVVVRFRLQSDQLLELDGWYVDNVAIADPGCLTVAVGNDGVPGALLLFAPSPNPVRSHARLGFALPAREEKVEIGIYDVTGRVVRFERLGAREPGVHSWTWNGLDGSGRPAASGAYFVRLNAGAASRTQKLLKLAQ